MMKFARAQCADDCFVEFQSIFSIKQSPVELKKNLCILTQKLFGKLFPAPKYDPKTYKKQNYCI